MIDDVLLVMFEYRYFGRERQQWFKCLKKTVKTVKNGEEAAGK
jgi:hypothetical protein